jgi:filamentous hemagglutinin family protein
LRHSIIAAVVALTALQPVLQAASSLPTGGSFTAGSGNIAAAGNTLTINQSTLHGVIDWSNFSIGKGGLVTFNNGSGATLNRVNGGLPSAILGQLLASGSVYILNPQGVLIGHGATVHTGGDFLASTLNLSDSAFLKGGSLLLSGPSTATVVNLGDLTSSGGSIYLIGHSVQNGGSMNAPNGTVGLAAGSQILITNPATDQRVFVQAPGGDITNSGYVNAAQVELRSNGGNIYALAGNNGGQIRATGTTTRDGHVWLVATNGTANVAGLVSATNVNGTGGNIETSGAHVLTNAATIKTGKNGNWLLDPDDLLIDSTLAGTIQTSLNGGTNVTEQTTASGTGGSGDITVASNIAWTGGAGLTLSAYRNIGVNNGVTISNNGAGNLTLRADNTSNGTGAINFNGTGKVDFSASTGNVALLYNPSSFASPTSYSSNVLTNGSWVAPQDKSVSTQLTAYMLVNNANGLTNIATNAAGTYALGTDIDLTPIANFTPIDFSGVFDGMGHTISNLTITNPGTSNAGLFGAMSGTARNVNLTNANITVDGSTSNVGVIAGTSSGTLTNVNAGGMIHVLSSGSVGGLVGNSNGTIWGSSASTGFDFSNATYLNYVGGLAGQANGVNNSSASGSINAPLSAYAFGGLIGYGTAAISNSYATGNITAPFRRYVGGLVGYDSYANVTNSYATGALTATGTRSYTAGGLLGYGQNATITNSYSNSVLSFTSPNNYASVGGLAGNSSYVNIVGSHFTGNISASNSSTVGGLIGYDSYNSNITNSYSTANITAGSNSTVGGLAGTLYRNLTNSFSTGNVTAGDNSYVGGLIGSQFSSSGSVAVSYALGAVTAGNNSTAGGLVGYNLAPLTDVYARGAVTAGTGSTVGGLAGQNASSSATVTNGYSSGLVTVGSGSTAGGLVGIQRINVPITTSYWDNQASGFPTIGVGSGSSTGVTGLTTAQLLSGNMPTGFNTNNTVWVAPVNVLPYFGWQGSLVTVSGTAYNGTSTIPSAGVGVFWQGSNVGATATASNGFYSVSIPQNMTAGGILAYLSSGGTANTFNDGTGPNLFTVTNLWTNTLTVLNNSTSSTLSGLNSALSLALGANAGSNFLYTVPSGILSLASGTNLHILATPNFTIDQALTGAGNILINGAGNLSIASASPITAASGNGITLITAGAFTNNGGASALNVSSGGNWLVYSQNPANDTLGGLTPAFKQYDATYGVTTPAQSADGLLYTIAPVITATLTGTVSKTYDGTVAATLSSGDYSSTGAINGDIVTLNTPASGTYASANVGSGIGVTASGISLSSVSNGSIPVYGYQVANASATGNIGTINPATLTYTATGGTRTYGSPNPPISGTITGFVDGQTEASATSGTLAFNTSANAASNVGAYAINGSGLSADNGNYIFTQADGNASALTIHPAVLTYTTTTDTSTKGSTTETFSGTVTGFVNGQTEATATSGTPTFTTLPTAASSEGSYAIDGAGLTADHGNYIFTQAVTNTVSLPTPEILNLIVSTQPLLPVLLPDAGNSFASVLEPVNAIGRFQVDISNLGNSFALPQPPLTESSPLSGTEGKKSKYVAGAKP